MKTYQSTKVMGFGTFDGLHPGHMSFLRQLKELGDEVYIVVARDRNVKKFKGKKPKLSERERVKGIEETRIADKVLLGHATNLYYWINTFQPHVIGLGYDQKANIEELKEKFPLVEIRVLSSFEPETYKSSLLN